MSQLSASFATGVDPAVRRARVAVAFVFFACGVIFSSWVPHIPLVQQRIGLSDGELGLALFFMAIGAISAMPLCGWLTGKVGGKRVCSISSLAFCLALYLPTHAESFAQLAAALFVFGACSSGMDVSMNAEAVRVEKDFGRAIMSSFHGFFSLGGLTGALIGGGLLALGVSSQLHITLMIVLIAVLCLLAFRYFLHNAPEAAGGHTFSLPSKPVLALGLLAFGALMAEGAMADWTGVYLSSVLGTSASTAAMGFAAFSVAMAAGRLSGDYWTRRLGPVNLMRCSAVIASAGLVMGLLFAEPLLAMVGFACVRIGLANIVPLVFSAAGRVPGMSAGNGIAAVATSGYTGFLAGRPLIGFLSELMGLALALGVVAVIILAAGPFAHVLRNRA